MRLLQGAERKCTELLNILETKYGMLSLTDVVWNHTAVCGREY